MNTKLLIIGFISMAIVIGVGVVSAFMVINNETPTTKQIEASNSEDNDKTEKKEEFNGWKEEKGSWYFYKDNEKQKNWVQDKGLWYYLGSDGKMRTGWIKDKEQWYYMNEDGTMATNMTVDGCYIGNDGTIEDTPNNNKNKYNSNADVSNQTGVNSANEAINIIYQNDSVYIEKCKRECTYGELGLEYFGNELSSVYGITPNEICYEVALTVPDDAEECTYLVGKETGNVYILPHEGTFDYYQIKNNQVVKTFYNGGNTWR